MILHHGVFKPHIGDEALLRPDIGVVERSVGWLVVWNFATDVIALDFGFQNGSRPKRKAQ